MRRKEEAFGEGVGAEEQSGVDDVTGESVPEIWNGRDVTGDKAGSVMWIGAHELPDSKIADEEKLNGAEKRGERDAGDGAAVAEPEADGDVDEKTGVDDGKYFVEADKDISDEESEEGEKESETAILQQCA